MSCGPYESFFLPHLLPFTKILSLYAELNTTWCNERLESVWNTSVNVILRIEKKVRGLLRISRGSPYYMVSNSGVEGGLDVNYSPAEFAIIRVDSVDVLICQS